MGFEVLDDVVTTEEAERYLGVLDGLAIEPLRGGLRRIEKLVPDVATLSQSESLLNIAKQYLADTPCLVRAIYFDKSPDNNWLVTWHQDRTVAVSERFEMDGWGPWTLKADAWHVQPPIEVLESMITIRIHLDPATKENGCLKVSPGSHHLGILPSGEVLDKVDTNNVVYCEASAGDAVIMRPHIIHSSEKSSTNLPRRVLHFEYSSYKLPDGIEWAA